MTKVFFFKSVNCVIHQSEELLEKIDDFDGWKDLLRKFNSISPTKKEKEKKQVIKFNMVIFCLEICRGNSSHIREKC